MEQLALYELKLSIFTKKKTVVKKEKEPTTTLKTFFTSKQENDIFQEFQFFIDNCRYLKRKYINPFNNLEL